MSFQNENKPRNTENIIENFPGENEPNSQNDDDYFSESEQKPPLGKSIMKKEPFFFLASGVICDA